MCIDVKAVNDFIVDMLVCKYTEYTSNKKRDLI